MNGIENKIKKTVPYSPLRIIIAGGGTGGHIFPAISIANKLKQLKPDIDIIFVGAKGKMEMEKVPQAGYKIEGLDIAGLNRGSLTKNLLLPYKLVKSFLQVKRIIDSFKPDAVVGVGGYSSYPVLRYAQFKQIPTFIHESNSFAGRSNMLLGKRATKIFVANKGMDRFFPKGKIILTGNPVRQEIANATITKMAALKSLGLDTEKRTLLVVGGSLGSKSINEVMAAHMNDIEDLNIQLIWQTGSYKSAAYVQRGKACKNVWVKDFISEMDIVYAAADAVISRSGAMSVAELCVVKKPVIFVPFPFAAEDHQTMNAKYLVDKNAAIMVKDSDVQSKLFSIAINLLFDEVKQKELIRNISTLGILDADEIIANQILNSIR